MTLEAQSRQRFSGWSGPRFQCHRFGARCPGTSEPISLSLSALRARAPSSRLKLSATSTRLPASHSPLAVQHGTSVLFIPHFFCPISEPTLNFAKQSRSIAHGALLVRSAVGYCNVGDSFLSWVYGNFCSRIPIPVQLIYHSPLTCLSEQATAGTFI
ncbi:hypothetical protein B0H63DRAFT_151422 [Podospora didyma]|uniref:Uncharacterized protein n=1 Tax=Podospora didyma TaxID=330526 RepID=A0AAE0U1I5_9PEZI|nr:hypothetical protein B0H63DRAFT_151422 [Podospora didyma]